MDGTEFETRMSAYEAEEQHKAVARKLIAEVQPNWDDLPKDRALDVGAVSAWEALRNPTRIGFTFMDIVYGLFLVFTLSMPLIVVLLPDRFRTLSWDALGIGSTMLLLTVTYGFYTLRMSWRFAGRVLNMFQYPPPVTGVARRTSGFVVWLFSRFHFRPPVAKSETAKRKVERARSRDQGDLAAAVNISLAGVGATLGYQACNDLLHIYNLMHFVAVSHAQAQGIRHSIDQFYRGFFDKVFVLSIAFVAMDLSIAMFDDAHEETFIGASSAAHATIPMALGIFLMWGFLHMEPDDEHLILASGALTFQMIMSNVLFIFIKKNLVFRFLYNSVRSTRRFARHDGVVESAS